VKLRDARSTQWFSECLPADGINSSGYWFHGRICSSSQAYVMSSIWVTSAGQKAIAKVLVRHVKDTPFTRSSCHRSLKTFSNRKVQRPSAHLERASLQRISHTNFCCEQVLFRGHKDSILVHICFCSRCNDANAILMITTCSPPSLECIML
jgi:hypothetical protein